MLKKEEHKIIQINIMLKAETGGKIMEKQWITCEEFAEKAGLSTGYVRELCVIGKKDKENGIIAEKLGKSWRIPIEELNRKLGLKENDTKQQIYIRKLEQKVKFLEQQVNTIKALISSINTIMVE